MMSKALKTIRYLINGVKESYNTSKAEMLSGIESDGFAEAMFWRGDKLIKLETELEFLRDIENILNSGLLEMDILISISKYCHKCIEFCHKTPYLQSGNRLPVCVRDIQLETRLLITRDIGTIGGIKNIVDEELKAQQCVSV